MRSDGLDNNDTPRSEPSRRPRPGDPSTSDDCWGRCASHRALLVVSAPRFSLILQRLMNHSAWTSSPSISPWPQIIAGIPIGFSVIVITLQGLNYVIDCYTVNANSALAGMTLVRSWAGAGFPLFAATMFRKLGVSCQVSCHGENGRYADMVLVGSLGDEYACIHLVGVVTGKSSPAILVVRFMRGRI